MAPMGRPVAVHKSYAVTYGFSTRGSGTCCQGVSAWQLLRLAHQLLARLRCRDMSVPVRIGRNRARVGISCRRKGPRRITTLGGQRAGSKCS
jgi:hypothetical protein